jgi:tRNA pseudouridine55 synthase
MAKYPARPINGILLLDKPLHLSSNQALQKVKHLLQAKKAGHTGSLDPLATGMLPICFGKATKLAQSFLGADKQYTVTAKLGETTATGDAEGEVLETKPVPSLTAEDLQTVLAKFKGEITQIPPMYSAVKIAGKPLYQLARQGITVERQPRAINIYALELVELSLPLMTLKVHCSKGTYIRTLAEDIGQALGCGAYVTALRRTTVGHFSSDTMLTIEQLIELYEAEGLAGLDRQLLAAQVPL